MLRPSPGPQWTTLAVECPRTSSPFAPSPSPPLGLLSDDEEHLPPLFHAIQLRRRAHESVSARDHHDGALGYPGRDSECRSNGELSEVPAILNRERSTNMDEPILEYYDGDVDDVLACQNSQSRQSSPAPVEIVRRRQHTPSSPQNRSATRMVNQQHTHALETQGKVNLMPDDDVDVIVILSSEEEQDNHDGVSNTLYYTPKASSSSRKNKPKPKPKSRSRLRQEVSRRSTVIIADTSPKAARGKVIYVDPNPIELSDTPDPLPCPRPSRPLPRPLYRARRSPSLSPYESDPPLSQPPPRTPHTPRTPPRTPLFLPTPSPQSPPEQLVHSAPVPIRSRNSVHPSTQTYTPTPAWAPRITVRLAQEQASRHVDRSRGRGERKGIRERRERREGAQANTRKVSASSSHAGHGDNIRAGTANDVIELSDADSDPDSDFAAFEDIVAVCTPRKRKRLHHLSPASPTSTRAAAAAAASGTTSAQTARKTVSMPVKVAKTKEKEKADAEAFAAQFVESVAQWPSARKIASAGAGLKRRLPVNPGRPRVRHKGW